MLGMLIGLSQLARSESLDVRAWPLALSGLAVVYREFAVRAWAVCMMLFGIYFPHRWSADARRPWLKWVLAIPLARPWPCGAPPAASYSLSTMPPAPAGFPRRLPPGYSSRSSSPPSACSSFRSPSSFATKAMAPDDRRRLKVIYWGSTASMAPLFLLIVLPAALLTPRGG